MQFHFSSTRESFYLQIPAHASRTEPMSICRCGWVHACIRVGVNLVSAVYCYVSDIVFFLRNGSSMGVAFDTVKTGPGFAYFPAFSLSMGENVHVNFGATPLTVSYTHLTLPTKVNV